jgi:phospholipid N-methyltransferase
VLEVGPGTGNMTVKLLEKAKKVKEGDLVSNDYVSTLSLFINMHLFQFIAIIFIVILDLLLEVLSLKI